MPREIRKRPLPADNNSVVLHSPTCMARRASSIAACRAAARHAAMLAITSLLGTLIGCGEAEPTLYPVTITVIFPDNKPAPGAQVVLRSTEHTTTSRGTTGEDGSCQLTTFEANDGASPGAHQVLIAEPPHIG